MTPDQILFILVAASIIAFALLVVASRNLVHAALWLIATLFAVAILFVILGAGFIALVQVVVYIGAIAILFIFAVMLTRRELRDKGPQLNKNWWVAAVLGMLTFAGLAFLLSQWERFWTLAAEIPAEFDSLASLGISLVSMDSYALPFEVASVLLLAALVGAVYVAASRK